ncbi:hypothetical protein GGI12_000480 [Dipsacomyces acuminosporus]|nr:hypothetical protein GGI12_000480 [Dipsacomyces acuminosporus]
MSGPFGLPLPLLTDSYKASHFALYPEAKQASAYAEFRQGFDKDTEDERIVFYGMRYIIEEYVSRRWRKEDVDLAEAFFSTHNAGFTKYPFPKELFLKFISEKKGYFPVRIEALPEGSVVYPHTPVFQITANDEYAPLITYLETVLLMVWYPSTVATLSRRSRTEIERFYAETVADDGMQTLDSRMHDFGFRGCTCVEQSMVGGAAHLLNFEGTDTLSAAFYVQYKLNNGKPVATSIPATEHSVMTSFRSEYEALVTTISAYGEGVFACVMDSYDYARALSDVLPAVAQAKLKKGGFMVVRPDSGDQVEAVLMGLRAIDKVFGHTVNEKGFKVIDGASIIQGDGVTPATLSKILAAVHEAGYSAQCVGFGMGGGLLQKVNRDTMSLAVKLSSITYKNDTTRDIMKFPKGESGKTSLPGHFAVHSDPAQNGAPVVYRSVDAPEDSENLLQLVYDCGPVKGHVWDDYNTVRRRVGEQWSKFPAKHSAVSKSLLAYQQEVHDHDAKSVSSGKAFGV